MNSERIKEIQAQTAYPESVSVKQALLQVWNECEQENNKAIDGYKNRIIVLQNLNLKYREKLGISNEPIDGILEEKKVKTFYCKNKVFVENYHGTHCTFQCTECRKGAPNI